jgi:hypothetical protein
MSTSLLHLLSDTITSYLGIPPGSDMGIGHKGPAREMIFQRDG